LNFSKNHAAVTALALTLSLGSLAEAQQQLYMRDNGEEITSLSQTTVGQYFEYVNSCITHSFLDFYGNAINRTGTSDTSKVEEAIAFPDRFGYAIFVLGDVDYGANAARLVSEADQKIIDEIKSIDQGSAAGRDRKIYEFFQQHIECLIWIGQINYHFQVEQNRLAFLQAVLDKNRSEIQNSMEEILPPSRAFVEQEIKNAGQQVIQTIYAAMTTGIQYWEHGEFESFSYPSTGASFEQDIRNALRRQ